MRLKERILIFYKKIDTRSNVIVIELCNESSLGTLLLLLQQHFLCQIKSSHEFLLFSRQVFE